MKQKFSTSSLAILILGLALIVINVIFWQQSQSSIVSETYNDSLAADINFDFPDNWNVYTKNNVDISGLTTIELSPLQLGDCLECGGYFSNSFIEISIARYPLSGNEGRVLATATSLNEIVNDLEDRQLLVTQSSEELENGILTTLSSKFEDNFECDSPGCDRHATDMLIFTPTENTDNAGVFVTVSLSNYADSQRAWDLVKSTIDFSQF